MKRKRTTYVMAGLLFLLATFPSCTDNKVGEDKSGIGGHTLRLTLAANVSSIAETKAIIQPARPGSEAEEAGFSYELVSVGVDTTGTTPETKAPTTLKNAYALLFTSEGAFNGRADIGTITAGTATDITFKNVTTPTATNCRLVIVANDNAAATSYSSTGGTGNFASFSGNYIAFQALTMNAVTQDVDIPYAGSAIVNLSLSELGGTVSIPLYRTLAKITLSNTFSITNGPARNSVTLYNAGERRFASNNNYDGTGSTATTTVVASTTGTNTNSNTWYVGENIQGSVSGVTTTADRNSSKAPAKACYIRIASAILSIKANTNPAIGEEYITSGSESFTYDIYLGNSSDITDFSVRRHTNYNITSSISGTLLRQEDLATSDKRVTLTKTGGSAGLCIGRFGGASGYTEGTVATSAITGKYTKYLLLQPNTSGSTAEDNVTTKWSDNTTDLLQPQNRRYWDHTYTLSNIDKTSGLAYDYCYNLTLGGVTKGTWYLPTQTQVAVIWNVLKGLQGSSTFAYYNSFRADTYWSSTEYNKDYVWGVSLITGNVSYNRSKTTSYNLRCVREAPSTTPAGQNITTIDGYPVVDLSDLSPLGCILSSSEAATRRATMNAQTPSNSTYLDIGSSFSGSFGYWNTQMTSKFQVMRADHTIGRTDWANAYTQCKQYSGEGGAAGEWRLPTQRELLMIWVLYPQLIGKGDFTTLAIGCFYWSSTEYYGNSVWYIDINRGDIYYTDKTTTHRVRCIRDL